MNKVHPLQVAPHTSVWTALKTEAGKLAQEDQAIAPMLQSVILPAKSLPESLGLLLAPALAERNLPEGLLLQLFHDFAAAVPDLQAIVEQDLKSIAEHDPAARDWVTPFLFFKGFHALQSYRLSHYLWSADRQHLAQFLQSRISVLYGVDIHPAARIGRGVMMDHATGIVIGETAVVEDNVLFWHGVTLGSRSFTPGDRHPKIRSGAMLGANATLIGNIEIGKDAKVAAGSIVVTDVAPGTTVAGVPAKPVS